MNNYFLAILSLSFLSAPSQAQSTSAADLLLKSIKGTDGAPAASGTSEARLPPTSVIQEEIKLENPVARQLFNDWNAQNNLSYEMNSWIKQFFANHFETFAHLKTAMSSQTDLLKSPALRQSLEAAYVYSLYRENLSQTFINTWMTDMDNSEFANSRASQALDEGIASAVAFDSWLLKEKIIFSPSAEALIKKIGTARHSNWMVLNSFVSQRKGILAEEFLPKLPMNSPFRPKLSMTVALAYAKKGDLGSAAKVLKLYYEPWVNQSKDAKAVSSYTLQIARLLYQIGSIDGAIEYYSKIPKGSPDFITAREELAWSLLRKGDLQTLRGTLTTLTSSVMNDQFRPESYLVKSISDLKLCYYAEVEKDFSQFLKQHAPWAQKIEAALAASDSVTPRLVDEYSLYAMDAIQARNHELERLQGYSARSESAALPAVGPQKQWTLAMQNMKSSLEDAKKMQAQEFRRQWKSDKAILTEAIRKMQFVKVELLSQVAESKKLSEVTPISKTKSDEMKSMIKASADQNFPFEGVIWPDELFKLRSVTQGQCIGQM